MSNKVEKISGNQIKISFEIPADEFDKAMQQAYLKVRGRIAIPGFRKGKAPRKIIENFYGEGAFYEEALDVVFPDAYEAAVKENNLEVVDRPEMDNVEQIGSGKDLKFSVKVYVSPDITLGDYKGLKGARRLHKVTDEEIEQAINRDVEKATTTVEFNDRTLEEGDIVNLDYAGTVDGVAFEGGTASNQTLELGSHSFIPGFEEQMIGMAIGEEKDLNVTFPEEYHAENLKGKAAVFHVKVNSAQKKVKPELNDDFAADVSEFDTFEAYKADIIRKLEETAAKNASISLENELVQAATDAADCDIPDAMIQDEIETMIREMKMRMASMGISYEQYMQYTGQTDEGLRDMYRSDAQNRVKMQLVLQAIRKAEDIQVTDEDVEKQYNDEAERMHKDVEEFKASLNDRQKDYLRENAAIRKVVDLIVANAVITDEAEAPKVDVGATVDAITEAVEETTASEDDQ